MHCLSSLKPPHRKCFCKFIRILVFFCFWIVIWRNVGVFNDDKAQEIKTIAFMPSGVEQSENSERNTSSATIRVKVIRPRKRFGNSEARDVAVFHENSGEITVNTTKMIYMATSFFGNYELDHYFNLQTGRTSFINYQCPYSNCLVTHRKEDLLKSDAVLFHVRDLDMADFPSERTPEQKWILYTMEPPWLDLVRWERLDGLFNWTMSYRRDSDIVVKYGMVAANPDSTAITMDNSQKLYLAVWFVSDCCTQSRREDYVKELRQHMPVDVIGGCSKMSCKPAESKACYDNLLPKYRFYLSFENALCKDYVTEKFFNALDQDVVPVVFGGADYATLAPPGSYVNALDFVTPRHLAEYLKSVAKNETLYANFFSWKRQYKSYLHAWPCDLCAKLNKDGEKRVVKTGLSQWWLEAAQCKSWTPDGVTSQLPAVVPCYKKVIFS